MTTLREQGDVLVFSIESFPEGKREIIYSGILASGESTGHHHRITETKTMMIPAAKPTMPTLFRIDGVLYIEAPEPFTVTHEEHKPINVPAGKYRVGIVKEYDYDLEESRNVAD